VHVLLGLVVLKLAVVLVAFVHASGVPKLSVLIALMVFFLPALVYTFLTGLWMMRTLAEVSRLARR
jgi:heme/copper-type cytochrome/quinol oxidase subunit 4